MKRVIENRWRGLLKCNGQLRQDNLRLQAEKKHYMDLWGDAYHDLTDRDIEISQLKRALAEAQAAQGAPPAVVVPAVKKKSSRAKKPAVEVAQQ